MIVELITLVVVGGLSYLVGKGVTLAKIEAEIQSLEASGNAELQKLAADIKLILAKLGL